MSMKPRKSPQKEHLEWMREAGYTIADMDAFWKENYGTNPVVTNLTDHGMTWRDMNLCVVQQLPTQKERDLEIIKKREAEALAAEEAARKEKEEREYYINHFEELMLKKIDNHEKLTEEELEELVWSYQIERIYGADHRWDKEVCSIINICDRTFAIDWRKGLTEMQDNIFDNQPYEVKSIEKVVVTKEWVPINQEV